LTVGPDERIYVATGAPCNLCVADDEQRGTILSFALDGSDKQLVTTGLRQPADLTFHMGVLWTVDSAPMSTQANMDELNHVVPGEDFGWPYCEGRESRGDLNITYFDCSEVLTPAFNFPAQSQPLGIVSYSSDTFPKVKAALLVVLAGVREDVNMMGYRLVAVLFDEGGNPIATYDVVPNVDNFYLFTNAKQVNYHGFGFWPHRPIDVTVNAEGWIYLSVGGGQIFALRPV